MASTPAEAGRRTTTQSYQTQQIFCCENFDWRKRPEESVQDASATRVDGQQNREVLEEERRPNERIGLRQWNAGGLGEVDASANIQFSLGSAPSRTAVRYKAY